MDEITEGVVNSIGTIADLFAKMNTHVVEIEARLDKIEAEIKKIRKEDA